jgi:hypothetical protein
VPWTTLPAAYVVITAGYLLGSGLLLRRRLTATEPPGTSTRKASGARGLDVLLLPDVLLLSWVGALAGLTGWARGLAMVVLPAVALALWIVAPRYVMSKVLPLALVGLGLGGILWAREFAHGPTYTWNVVYGFGPGYGVTGPVKTLAQAWAFIAAGLLLTWLRMDGCSATISSSRRCGRSPRAER